MLEVYTQLYGSLPALAKASKSIVFEAVKICPAFGDESLTLTSCSFSWELLFCIQPEMRIIIVMNIKNFAARIFMIELLCIDLF